MKLSTKGRYGLRAVLDIAMNCDGEPASLSSIAARQQLSESYLEQLIAKLKKAGIVFSARGSAGGYTLAKPAKEVKVGDVLRALEGDLTVCKCVEDDIDCSLFHDCVTKYVWNHINNSFNQAIDSMTLQDVVDYGKRERKEDDFDE